MNKKGFYIIPLFIAMAIILIYFLSSRAVFTATQDMTFLEIVNVIMWVIIVLFAIICFLFLFGGKREKKLINTQMTKIFNKGD